MKTLLLLVFMGCIFASTAQVGINTTAPDGSAMLDITATDKGILVPRMTEVQKMAISTPAISLLIYQTDGTLPGFYYYNGTVWVSLSAAGIQKIDDLTDGIATTNSLFLGENVGATETTGFRKNTSVGIISLQSVTTGIENTALGYSALRLNTTGSDNSAIGMNALNTNQTGNENVAFGRNTLFSSLSGSYNTAIGGNALYTNTTGGFNNAMGSQSLYRNTTGTGNNAVGSSSLFNNTTGVDNVAIGRSALSSNTTSNSSVAIGTNALLSFNSASSIPKNTAIGANSFRSTTTGTNNTGLGYNTGNSNTTGINNTAIGSEALYSSQTVSNTVAVGYNALRNTTTGTNNTGVGSTSLFNNTTGQDNTALGYATLYNNTTGTSNTAVGNNALDANTVGGNNTAVGKSALTANTDGLSNTAMGNFSLSTNTQGDANVAIGYWSLRYNNGNFNTALGSNALEQNIDGNGNTSIGYSSFSENTLGNNNVSVGDYSGRYVDGNNNVFLGRRAGANNFIANPSNNKSNNVMIGYEAGFDQLVDNRLFIENSSSANPLIYGEFDNNIVRINGELQVGNPTTTGYALSTTDGTAGQVMTTDGSGAVSFQTVAGDGDTQNTLDQAYDEGGPGLGRTISATNGAVLIDGIDGFQNTGTFGSGATLALTGAGTKMFFYPRKAAFRAGYVNGTQWNDANIGDYSTAFGLNNTASGIRSVAFGNNNTVNGEGSAAFGNTNNLGGYQSFAFGASNDLSGDNGVAFGESNIASGYSNLLAGISNTSSGESSIAMGQGNDVPGDISLAFGALNTVNSGNSVAIGTNLEVFSAYETVMGVNSTNYSPASTIAFNANDRLFAIGNGSSTAARSNALTIYKDGRMNINDAYTMPTTVGSANQVLTTDGSGTASWQNPTTPFELKDPKYPDGFSGMTPITMNNLSTTSYTVPAGKNLYMTNIYSNVGTTTLSISGTTVLAGIQNVGNYGALTNPLIAGSGNSISASTNALVFSGVLVNTNVTPITMTFTPSYTIPANKILVILNARTNSIFGIDGITIYSGNGNSQITAGLTSFHNPIFLDEGQVLAISSGAINGYLIDK